MRANLKTTKAINALLNRSRIQARAALPTSVRAVRYLARQEMLSGKGIESRLLRKPARLRVRPILMT
jgi:hypothetical protein